MENMLAELAKALEEPAPAGQPTLSQIRTWLRTEISYLVAKDHEKLKQVLYRVDVDEDFLLSSLAAQPEEKVDVLTDLILSRQLQKVDTRRDNPQPPASDSEEAL